MAIVLSLITFYSLGTLFKGAGNRTYGKLREIIDRQDKLVFPEYK
jgi:hypothetical protein